MEMRMPEFTALLFCHGKIEINKVKKTNLILHLLPHWRLAMRGTKVICDSIIDKNFTSKGHRFALERDRQQLTGHPNFIIYDSNYHFAAYGKIISLSVACYPTLSRHLPFTVLLDKSHYGFICQLQKTLRVNSVKK